MVIDWGVFEKFASWEDLEPVTRQRTASRQPQDITTNDESGLSALAGTSLDVRVARIEQQLDHFTHWVDNFIAYQVNFNTALANMFSQCALNSGPNAIQFPPPMFPEYPSTKEADADNFET